MNEKSLVLALVKVLRVELQNCVIFKHADRVTAGIPDLSVTWRRRTTWLEVKYANPKVVDRGLQNFVMKQLAISGSAYYVIYDVPGSRTLIVRPSEIEGNLWKTLLQANAPGFDHHLVSWFIKQLHTSNMNL